MPKLVEKEVTYSDGADGKLVGYVIYQSMPSDAPRRPGLMVFPGPYGDGGGKEEREVARKYAKKGMVVFLPDYYPTRNSEDNPEEVQAAIFQYGPFLKDSGHAQKIAKLGYDQLAKMPMVDADKIAAVGFCFGGAMALNLARSGAKLEAAVSLHGEYPELDVEVGTKGATGAYNTKYFVEMVGANDPFIPPAARDSWVTELSGYTAGTEMSYDFTVFGNTVHAFSIKYSQAFLDVLVQVLHMQGNKGAKKVGDGIPGVIQYNPVVATAAFDRIDDLFGSLDLFYKPAARDGAEYFDFKASLIWEKDSECKTETKGQFFGLQTLRRPINTCTTNVVGSSAVFRCDGKGTILEDVYYDVYSPEKGGNKDCSGKALYTMPIGNGCNDYDWGAMYMVWDDFCQAPKPEPVKPSGLRIQSDKASISFGPNGDVQIARTGDGKLSLTKDVRITGEVSAQKITIDGVPLEDFIAAQIAEALKNLN